MPWNTIGRGTSTEKPSEAGVANSPVPEAAVLQPLPRRAQGVATIPAKFRDRARRDAAAFYLSQLSKGVLAGELALVSGEQQVELAVSEFVLLQIEVKQKKRANHVSVKLRWPRRPLIRIAAAGGSGNGG
jgi:amphi-Trp domain-containing protein